MTLSQGAWCAKVTTSPRCQAGSRGLPSHRYTQRGRWGVAASCPRFSGVPLFISNPGTGPATKKNGPFGMTTSLMMSDLAPASRIGTLSRRCSLLNGIPGWICLQVEPSLGGNWVINEIACNVLLNIPHACWRWMKAHVKLGGRRDFGWLFDLTIASY